MQALARRKPDNPELMLPVAPPQSYVEVDGALPSAVDFGPAERARMVKASIDICEKKGVLGAGYIPKFHWTDAIANSAGLFAYHRYADASFILTCRTPDQTGSGWAGTTGAKDIGKQIDAVALTEVAADKALKSRKPKALEPGNYTVIMEPRPAARFLQLMLGAFDARAAEEGRSFMSGKERGTTRVGEKVFGDNVTLRSEIGNPILRQSPIGEGGLAAKSVTWVEKGVVKNLAYNRYWAQHQKVAPTATSPNMSLVMEGGTATMDEMIRSTKRGLLITFFWYIRPVDPDDPAQHRDDPRRPVPDRERRDRRPGAELPLERVAGGRVQQHHHARSVDPDAHRRGLRQPRDRAGAGDEDRRLHDDVGVAGGLTAEPETRTPSPPESTSCRTDALS